MKSMSVFLGITKVPDFYWKKADVRTQGVCHVIYILFGFCLSKKVSSL